MKKFVSDRTGQKIPEKALTTLKINRRSPIHARFGGELHLTDEEALQLADWIAGTVPPRKGKGTPPPSAN